LSWISATPVALYTRHTRIFGRNARLPRPMTALQLLPIGLLLLVAAPCPRTRETHLAFPKTRVRRVKAGAFVRAAIFRTLSKATIGQNRRLNRKTNSLEIALQVLRTDPLGGGRALK
jgi:hypothetical protein